MRFNDRVWYQSSLTITTALLLPFSWIYAAITSVRRWCYRRNIFKSYHCGRPLIVVGNITVGGTGKTPCVMALAKQLIASGWKPGIVSRGVGGEAKMKPVSVAPDASVSQVGDEALLLARVTQCPLFVCVDRVRAVRALLAAHPDCDVIISDDGLQHYRMQRDIEIAVVDGERHFGNGYLLPAGPLRESISRLNTVDFIITNGGSMPQAYTMSLDPSCWVALCDQKTRVDLASFSQTVVHACAGIGYPDRFFNVLRGLGHQVIPHAFPDHYRYAAPDLSFGDSLPVLMTAKDAVKCEVFADERMWYLDVNVTINPSFWQQLELKLKGLSSCQKVS